MMIGLTGKNGAGKGEVANLLKGKGFVYASLSDVLREKMQAARIEITRENLIRFANELRASHGGDILAKEVLAHVQGYAKVVVDSIRNPFEVEALRARPDFLLVAVVADPEIRFQRLTQRQRESDPSSYEAFLKIEAAEAGSTNPTTQQLNRTLAMADVLIENNGTLEELHQTLEQVLTTVKQTHPLDEP